MSNSMTPPIATSDEDPLLPVEEVARRLGVPLAVLVRRLEAGDVPANREMGPDGVRYTVRLSELGVESVSEFDPGSAEIGSPLEDSENELVAQSVPPPTSGGSPNLTVFDGYRERGPRGEVATMSLDAREIVGGLLDRWERTLEQRIYSEQRQRFEAELASRQTLVKRLQMELQTVRAEHAAVQAESERHLAEKERELADCERQLWASNGELGELRAILPKKRGWLFNR